MARRPLLILLGLAALAGCDDSPPTGEATAGADRGPRIVRDAAPEARPDLAGIGADAGPAPDAAPPAPDAAPPAPDCVADADCGPGAVCDRDRCIEGSRCDEAGACPPGRICLAAICLPDPRAAGGLVAEPARLVFPFGEVGEEVLRGVTVSNAGEDTLEILRLELGGDPQFALVDPPALPLRLVAGQRADLSVRYLANDTRDDQGSLRIHPSRGGPAEIALATQHKTVGGADPCLRLSPARLDFGAVARGGERILSATLTSCGQVPVTVNAIRRGASIFGALPDTFQVLPPPFPIVIAPGQRVPVDFAYRPRRAGIEAGFWEVFNDDPANPRLRLDVSALATPPPLEDIALHVRLHWSTDLTDVDLHLLGPGGQLWTCAGDCYFSNPNPSWGDPAEFRDDPFLDVDDVDGFGPENINLEAPAPGSYRVLVHYWADHGGDPPDATVEILEFGQVIGRFGPQRLDRIDAVWEVVELDWPGRQQRPLGGVGVQPRGPLCGGF